MKKYLLAVQLAITSAIAMAQISIQPVLPLAGIVQKNNFWNIAVIKSSAGNVDCRIEMTLRDRISGAEVLTATTGQFSLSAGARQLNAAALMPIQYNYLSPFLTPRTDDLVPIGNYTICYRLVMAGKNLLAEDCQSFDVEPLAPPMLISPSDSALLEVSPQQFAWTPPSPVNLFNRLEYETIITEILPGQKAEEAMQQNLPFYTESNLPVNNLSYRGTAASFEKDKWYAWQVVARDGNSYAAKSEVWVFKVSTVTPQDPVVEQAPFIKMKKEVAERGVAPKGVLKFYYNNETGDTMITVHLVNLNLNQADKKQTTFDMPLVPGENLLQKDLKKLIDVSKPGAYEAYIINARGEKWRVAFDVLNEKKNQQ